MISSLQVPFQNPFFAVKPKSSMRIEESSPNRNSQNSQERDDSPMRDSVSAGFNETYTSRNIKIKSLLQSNSRFNDSHRDQLVSSQFSTYRPDSKQSTSIHARHMLQSRNVTLKLSPTNSKFVPLIHLRNQPFL